MKPKILLTSGDSFTQCIAFDKYQDKEQKNWPVWLREILGLEHHCEAMGSQGNGLISRRVQYRLNQLLKQHAAQDIMVGVMWTSRDRFDFYLDQHVDFGSNLDGWIENPTTFIDQDPGGWLICNPHWTHPLNAAWYKSYHNEEACQIYTLEHILNCQRYFELVGVKYFFAVAFNQVFNEHYRKNPAVEYLWQLINWNRFLPVVSEHDWVKTHYHMPEVNNFHPRGWQHEKFVQEVVVPWLESNHYLD